MDIFSKRPLFTACMLFLLMSVVSFFLSYAAKIVIAIVFGIIFVVGLSLAVFKQIKHNKKYPLLCVLLCSLLISLASINSLLFFNVNQNKYEQYYDKDSTIKAVVISEKYSNNFSSSYEIEVQSVNNVKNNHRAILNCEYLADMQIGDELIVHATAIAPKDSAGRYNEKLGLLSDGIFISYISYDETSLVITQYSKNNIHVIFSKINDSISRIITQSIEGEAGNLSSAILLGNRELLSNSTIRDFTRAGVSHILALSGMHMSIIMGAMMFFLRKLIRKRKPTIIILSAFAIFYLALTGFSVSATRSVIMLLIVYLSILISDTADSLTSLSVAGFLIVLISPGSILDAAFWMSFSATLGILVYMPPLNEFLGNWSHSDDNKLPKFFIKSLKAISTTIAAGVFAIIPLVAVMCIFIKEISVFSVISSALLSAPASALILLSLLFVVMSPIPIINDILPRLIKLVSDLMIGYCSKVSEIEGIVYSLNYPFATVFAIIIAAALIYSFISKHRSPLKSLIPFAICTAMLFTFIGIYEHNNSDNLKVSYINASSNSDVVVLSKERQALICDVSNGSLSSYSKVLDELYDARITEVKAIMLTRYFYTYQSTLSNIFASERVRELWLPYPETVEEYDNMERLSVLADEHGVATYIYRDGMELLAFDNTVINHYSDMIDRSQVPISLISINTLSDRIVYVSPAFNESSLAEKAESLFSKSEYVIFGNRGPKTKTEYTVKSPEKLKAVIFADQTRVAYYTESGVTNAATFIVNDSIDLYLDK